MYWIQSFFVCWFLIVGAFVVVCYWLCRFHNCCNMYFIMRNGVIVNKLIIGLTRELVWFCFQHWLPGRVIIEILLIVLE